VLAENTGATIGYGEFPIGVFLLGLPCVVNYFLNLGHYERILVDITAELEPLLFNYIIPTALVEKKLEKFIRAGRKYWRNNRLWGIL
jgi:hypothetical protein